MSELPETPTQAELWSKRTRSALERQKRLRSFGPRAIGVVVSTPSGLFALDPADGFISQALLTDGVYCEDEFKLLASTISQQSEVLVVGAHIGAHAVRLAKVCASLVAVEANPHSFRFLQANLLMNECENAVAYHVAASDRQESLKFLANIENSGGSKRLPLRSHLAYVYDEPETLEVPAVSLDALLGARAFDLILMDIEGSEYFALKGMQNILQGSKLLAVEFISHMIDNVAGVSIDAYLEVLLPHFQWLCVPRHNRAYPHPEIGSTLRAMHAAQESHETIFLLKDPLPEWLLNRRG